MSRYYCLVRLVVWTHYVGVGLGNKRLFALGRVSVQLRYRQRSGFSRKRFPSTSSDAEATDFCFFLDTISDFAHCFVRIVSFYRLFLVKVASTCKRQQLECR